MAAAGRLIVFKVGSSTLVDETGSLDRVFIRSLCDQVVALREAGNQVVVVSSGARRCRPRRSGPLVQAL